jgi:hypothetical protein
MTEYISTKPDQRGTDFNNGDRLDIHAARQDLLPLEQVVQDREAQGRQELTRTPEVLTDHQQLAVITQNAKYMRDYELAA